MTDPSAPHSPFVDRHIGLRPADIEKMLDAVGHDSLESLMAAAVPGGIRADADLDLPEAVSEDAAARELRHLAAMNRPAEAMIGCGYHAHDHAAGDPPQRAGGPRPGTPPTRRTSRRSPRAASRR